MNSKTIASCLLVLLGIPFVGQTSGVALNFTGTLQDMQCTFEQDDAPLLVEMPIQTVRYFWANSRSGVKPFDIGLKNCTTSAQGKLVTLTFNAASTQVIGGVTMLGTTGGTGLVIGLEDGTGNLVSVGKPVTAGRIENTGQGTVNRYRFGAYLTTSDPSTVKEGAYTATATFQVTYQ